MDKQILKDALGWGFLLWLVGYALGIILFSIVPPFMIGWIIMPIGIVITLWVLFKKIKGETFQYYIKLAVFWTLVAIIFDYFFLVEVFKPADGYYKLDVYLYYTLTFILPLMVGWRKRILGRMRKHER
jgi:type III secretory pathway component EscS